MAMPLANVVIVDYGTGNLNSLNRALGGIGARSVISSSAEVIAGADKIILPGVGHFGTAMYNLELLDLVETLHELVLIKQKPVLGICLGMELMAKGSDEAETPGLGWIDAQAIRLSFSGEGRHKIPHMGWNQVSITKSSRLMDGVAELSEFYFAHSYHLQLNDRSDLLNETQYGGAFPSAIEKNNIFGVQYHPEKSHDVGAGLLKNFVEM